MSDGGSPTPELLRALAVISEPPTPETARVAEGLGLPEQIDPSDHADVFLFQLYPYASIYLGGEGMMGGEAADRIAGFWRAVGQTPPPEPDHLAALLGLYAALLEAGGAGDDASHRLEREAADVLLWEHLAPWVFSYLEHVQAISPRSLSAWAGLLETALRAALSQLPARATVAIPTHLRTAPELEDPRSDAEVDFLGSLLAPARTGVILTRSDLAGVAVRVGVGLRAGERRFALKGMISQDAAGVLTALAAHAEAAGAAHRAREGWLAPIARHHALRADRAAHLLGALALDGDLYAQPSSVTS